MIFLNILLDVVILAFLLFPLVNGIRRGFLHTLLHFGKSLIAFIVASCFAKPLGLFLKNAFFYDRVYDKVYAQFTESAAQSSAEMVAKVPEGMQNTLSAFGVDVNAMAEQSLARQENAISDFSANVAGAVSGAIGFAVAFIALFFACVFLLRLLTPILDKLVNKLPVIGKINRILGAVIGVVIGILFAWAASQMIVGVLGLFTDFDWTGTWLLSFFYTVSPLNWLLRIAIAGMTGVIII